MGALFEREDMRMIDTIRVESPAISQELYEKLKSISIEKLAYDHSEQELLYSFTSNDLSGSYDNRIMLQLRTDHWVRFHSHDTGKWVTELLPCPPYLVSEFSIHKFYVGHNVCKGFNDLPVKFAGFVAFLEKLLDCSLPISDDWKITRLDYAETFRVREIEEWFKYLNNCQYPRRPVMRYPTALFAPGRTTSVRFYSKEHEFKKHDLKKLMKIEGFDTLTPLRESKNLLRVEVQIKNRKLKDLCEGDYTMKDYKVEQIQMIYDKEVCKIFQLKEERRIYNNARDVEKYLNENFTSQMANSLFAFYTKLAIFGKDDVRAQMPKRTFYKYLKILREAGISFTNTDLEIKEEKNPYADFVPTLDSIYKVS